MVAFREHYLVIVEPENFNVYKNCLTYPTLGFVIESRSVEFQDYAIGLVSQYVEQWHSHYSSALLKGVRSDVIGLIHRTMRNNRITIRTICALTVLAYYIAAMQGKALHLRQFTTDIPANPQYFTYIGITDYSSEELLQKMAIMSERVHQDANRLHYFIYPKDIPENAKLKRSKQLNMNVSL
jgi:hypothetical protein